jgi:hypothetical protein
VILEGSSPNRGIAEAMTYLRNYDSYWRPLKTNEGEVLNAVLMDSAQDSATIAHEVMHLYGLTDLYGTNTGPGSLSLMSSNALNLLSYEKWILGWLPDGDVTCLANVSESSITKFSFDYTKTNQIAIIRSGSKETFIAETTKVWDTRYLTFYSIDNEARPPITVYQDRSRAQNGDVSIEDYSAIGTQFTAPDFTLLVSDLNSTSISLILVPKSLSASTEFKSLIDSSNAAKNTAQLKARQEVEAREAREAEELKAKQDSEEAAAKVAADLKAKQKAEAKAAAPKKSSITCVKGKLTKKVTAVKPKCPAGYRVKK